MNDEDLAYLGVSVVGDMSNWTYEPWLPGTSF